MGWMGEVFLDLLILSSDLCTCSTFATVFLKMRKDNTAVGMSLQTIFAVVSARTLHIFSHFLGLHYVPSQLPWIIFPLLDVLNATIGVAALFKFCTTYYATYEREKDNFGIHLLARFNLLPKSGPFKDGPMVASSVMYGVVLVVAYLWYFVRRSNNSFLSSYFCCYYEVLSAVALFPQLWMFHQDKRVPPLLANFVVLTAVNRLCVLSFWLFYPWVFVWRYPDNRGVQMASETLNILILSDFLYYWMRSKLRGESEVIIGDALGV